MGEMADYYGYADYDDYDDEVEALMATFITDEASCSDEELVELFAKYSAEGYPLNEWWTTKDGRHLRYTEMADSHLQNALRYFQRSFAEACMVGNNPSHLGVVKYRLRMLRRERDRRIGELARAVSGA